MIKMKFINILISSIAVLIFFSFSCKKEQDYLERALRLAGDNRPELEKVLEYYRKNPEDSLKLRAAKFLISNMPLHYSYGGQYYEDYVRRVDSVHRDLPIELRSVLYTLPEKYPSLAGKLEIKPDVENVTAEYLIHNMEHSFEMWKNSYWLRELSFENFCEYLLPYRLSREPLLYWEDSLRNNFREKIKDGTANLPDVAKDPYVLYRFLEFHLMGDSPDYMVFEIDMPDPVIGKYKFDCMTGSFAYAYLWRMCGIPVAVDEMPHWKYGNNNHSNIAIVDEHSAAGFITNESHLTVAKVFRKTFSNNGSYLLQNTSDYVPNRFRDRLIKDVTAGYVKTSDITIDLKSVKRSPSYVYLGIFDLGWDAVDYAKVRNGKATFKDVGVEYVYIPFYYTGKRQVFFSNPFYLDAKSKMHYFEPDLNRLRTITLDRKDKVDEYKIWWSQFFINARIEASDNAAFNKAQTLFTQKENTYWRIIDIPIKPSEPYRYYRFINYGWPTDLGEIHFYGTDGKEVKGTFISDPVTIANPNLPNIQDGNILTFSAIESWVGIDFGRPVSLSRIEYVPRNDKNGIYPGMQYELFYFDTDHWASMGVKTATEYTITYDQVPEGALLWIRNLTEGKEERIFTYENGKQVWW